MTGWQEACSKYFINLTRTDTHIGSCCQCDALQSIKSSFRTVLSDLLFVGERAMPGRAVNCAQSPLERTGILLSFCGSQSPFHVVRGKVKSFEHLGCAGSPRVSTSLLWVPTMGITFNGSAACINTMLNLAAFEIKCQLQKCNIRDTECDTGNPR